MDIKNEIEWDLMSKKAWAVRENSFLFSNTKVGASVLSESSKIYVGCNVQQVYRNDIHAETNAIGNMISNGDKKIKAILVVAERNSFTPCGACMDWIMQFGGENCIIGFQNTREGGIIKYFANELMPHYPK